MSRTICFIMLFLVLFSISCTKQEFIDINTTPKEITVHPGMDYYVEQTQGKWIWQIYLDFDQSVTNASGNATIEFVTYKRQKHDRKQLVKIDWSIPSSTKTTNYVYNTAWTTYDFDDVDSIILKSINCTNGNYHFKIK